MDGAVRLAVGPTAGFKGWVSLDARGALDWTEMSRNQQSRKHERTRKSAEDIGDQGALTPPGERGEHEEGSTDGKTKPSTFTSRQSSWYVCRHSSDSGIAGCSFL